MHTYTAGEFEQSNPIETHTNLQVLDLFNKRTQKSSYSNLSKVANKAILGTELMVQPMPEDSVPAKLAVLYRRWLVAIDSTLDSDKQQFEHLLDRENGSKKLFTHFLGKNIEAYGIESQITYGSAYKSLVSLVNNPQIYPSPDTRELINTSLNNVVDKVICKAMGSDVSPELFSPEEARALKYELNGTHAACMFDIENGNYLGSKRYERARRRYQAVACANQHFDDAVDIAKDINEGVVNMLWANTIANNEQQKLREAIDSGMIARKPEDKAKHCQVLAKLVPLSYEATQREQIQILNFIKSPEINQLIRLP